MQLHQQARLGALGQLLGLTLLWDVSSGLKLPRAVILSLLHGPEAASHKLQPSDLYQYSDNMADVLLTAQKLVSQLATDLAPELQQKFDTLLQTFEGFIGSLAVVNYDILDGRRIIRNILTKLMIEPSRALLEQLHAGFKLISVGEPVLAKAWELLGEAALSEHFSDTIIFTSATFVLVPIGSDAQTGFVQEWINQAKEADLADFARFATTSKHPPSGGRPLLVNAQTCPNMTAGSYPMAATCSVLLQLPRYQTCVDCAAGINVALHPENNQFADNRQ